MRTPSFERSSVMKLATSTIIAAAALAILPLSAAAGSGELAWKSWDAGIKESGSAKKPVLVDVYTDWCGWCKRMDRDVYSREDVRTYLQRHFVTVRLNAE